MKLWQKNDLVIDKVMEKFTVGNDYLLDINLAVYDVKVNKAHAKMLNEIGLLEDDELSELNKVLDEIEALVQSGKFKILPEQEDVHTAIEHFLTEKLGDIGKKIHAGKSRNDQVMTDLLLYCKHELTQVIGLKDKLSSAMESFAEANKGVPMPGYTHMQKAMPYSVSEWILSFCEMLEDDSEGIDYAMSIIDKSPLGSAAGYGLPIDINKESTAKELSFKKVHSHSLYVQNSKGKHELVVMHALNQLMLTMNKLASDLMLFTTSEFNYFELPPALCTGSSIMPQKKNYDVLELIRGKTSSFQAKLVEINSIYTNLISGYNRDSQLMKQPLIGSSEIAESVLHMMAVVINNLQVNKADLEKAMTEELYATQDALDLVKDGMSFREAYKKIGEKYNKK